MALHPLGERETFHYRCAGVARRDTLVLEDGMTRYALLTKKADALEEAASKCKTDLGKAALTRVMVGIIGVRDSMTVEEAEVEE